MGRRLEHVSIEEIEAARARIAGNVVRTPLVRLNVDDTPTEIFLKLENLQPTGAFKIRGVSNVIALAEREARARGVYTVSTGNMAHALAWHARCLGIPCTVIVPENAARTKVEAVERLGAGIVELPWEEIWKVDVEHKYLPLEEKMFVHPFSDERMIAGHGTIGLELLEDLPDVDCVIVPFGGGGLALGIASAIKAKRPTTTVFGVEPETAAPLAASFEAGSAKAVNRIASFVDGIGERTVLPEIWEHAKRLLQGSLVVSLQEIALAVKLLAERHRVIAEGAGAAPLAAALTGKAGPGKVVAVVSGGNIDSSKLATILQGGIP